MDHFDIILVLARIALDSEPERAKQQLNLLREALQTASPDQAAKLGRLLTRAGRRHAMVPMAMEELRSTAEAVRRQFPGEQLSPSTPVPTDRETGTPLARIIFPTGGEPDAPILNAPLAAAVDDLLAEWGSVDELAQIGARPNTRCLLFGPPGVGKTKLARHLARRLSLPCVEARLDGLVSSFLGTTARNIGALFDFANRYRCVLFLDEFDAVAKARDDAQEIGEIKRVVNTLLQSIDMRNGRGITLAATNHDHLLDSAVWRRFDSRIELHPPDQSARDLLLRHFLAPIRLEDFVMKLLVWATEGMSGADIEMLVEAGKRFFVLRTKSEPGSPSANDDHVPARIVVESLQRQAALNARLFAPGRATALSGPREGLNEALSATDLTQVERGALLGISQSSVSRGRRRQEST